MAICYQCGEQFSGDQCSECGWEAEYSCWNCGYEINVSKDYKCKHCGWFRCDECDSCGCEEERPPSNEEKEEEFMR